MAPLLLVGCGAETRPPSAPPTGEVLYLTACASCHGADLAGRTGLGPAIPPELSEIELRAVIRNGVGTMVGFPDLSGAEIDAIVAYVRSVSVGS